MAPIHKILLKKCQPFGLPLPHFLLSVCLNNARLQIIRQRIYTTLYWKEQCFGLDAEVHRGDSPKPLLRLHVDSLFLCTTLRLYMLPPFRPFSKKLVDRAIDLEYVGGIYGGLRKPTKVCFREPATPSSVASRLWSCPPVMKPPLRRVPQFLCLVLKMLQIQPEKDIIVTFI